jgi:hypothetical protein
MPLIRFIFNALKNIIGAASYASDSYLRHGSAVGMPQPEVAYAETGNANCPLGGELAAIPPNEITRPLC